ncbi:hypothetical protein V6N13_106886 [Hibiscus sabdariffa]|uniref:Uncharacterized protein n=1 Tax=Hibiscus sabdariffa TaxID=183260 RepID=A0ABR2F229_9ROSI
MSGDIPFACLVLIPKLSEGISNKVAYSTRVHSQSSQPLRCTFTNNFSQSTFYKSEKSYMSGNKEASQTLLELNIILMGISRVLVWEVVWMAHKVLCSSSSYVSQS